MSPSNQDNPRLHFEMCCDRSEFIPSIDWLIVDIFNLNTLIENFCHAAQISCVSFKILLIPCNFNIFLSLPMRAELAVDLAIIIIIHKPNGSQVGVLESNYTHFMPLVYIVNQGLGCRAADRDRCASCHWLKKNEKKSKWLLQVSIYVCLQDDNWSKLRSSSRNRIDRSILTSLTIHLTSPKDNSLAVVSMDLNFFMLRCRIGLDLRIQLFTLIHAN